MTYRHLLAKLPTRPECPLKAESLVGHTESVLLSAEEMLPFIASGMKRSLGFQDEEMTAWSRSFLLAAWIHDWGKANDHFQDMLLQKIKRQGIRHETVSMVLLDLLSDWVFPPKGDLPVWAVKGVYIAVGLHHFKCQDIKKRPVKDRSDVAIFTEHEDFQDLLLMGSNMLGLAQPPTLRNIEFSLLRGGLIESLKRLEAELDDFRCTTRQKTLIACLKVALMNADLAGSALPRSTKNLDEWLHRKLKISLDGKDLEKIVDGKLSGCPLRNFQKNVAEAESKTILAEAGCGSGKTVAAYLWAARRADSSRLFFCYPTTGTASEGFSGYLHDPDFESILIHSRSEVDYRLLENMPARGSEEAELIESRLEAMETWPIPAVVCTAHTVLGLFENVRRGVYAWPALIRGTFVFDEIHAYSERLFSYLLTFLEMFRESPVLLMTATLPEVRRKALEEVCKSRGGLMAVKGPKERESALRYVMRDLGTQGCEEAKRKILDVFGESYNGSKKVLWICNTIKSAAAIYDWGKEHALPVELYHSRYRYRDRLRRHRAVIDAFGKDAPILAVTTQVAEMSLDISADVLVSEYAPIWALIQRLGRLNRKEEIPSVSGTALLYSPSRNLPYDEKLLEDARKWLSELCDGTARSQADLAAIFLKTSFGEKRQIFPFKTFAWKDASLFEENEPVSIEESGYTSDVVREEDLPAFNLTEIAIPMPNVDGMHEWKRLKRFFVAPTGSMFYDERRGGEWKSLR